MGDKERLAIAQEIWAYADSIDEFTTQDDIYSMLVQLGAEVNRGEYQ